MKTLLINTALMLAMFAAPAAATTGMRHATAEHTVCTSPDHNSQKGNRWHNKRKRYFVINNKVYYNGEVVNGATASGFKILDDGYAADDFRVYLGAACLGVLKKLQHEQTAAFANDKTVAILVEGTGGHGGIVVEMGGKGL